MEVGAWMDINGASIYGTTASPFDSQLEWGRCTKKIRENGATLYFHVFDWPANGKLVVPGLKNTPSSIRLLQTGEALQATVLTDSEGGVVIDVPKQAPDPIASVIQVEIEGQVVIEPILPTQDASGQIELLSPIAELHNIPFGKLQLIYDKGVQTGIGYWTDPRTWVGWTFRAKHPGTFKVVAELASNSKATLAVGLSGQPAKETVIEPTGSFETYQVRELGEITISEAGKYHIEFKPVENGWAPINLGKVTLKPVTP